MKIRDQKAAKSREKILDAAAQAFAATGFAATGIQEIARAAGVARGTPGYFFSSKEKLFQAAFARESEKAADIVPNALATLNAGASPEETLWAFIDTYLDFLDANPIFFRLIRWSSLEEHHLIDDVKAHWQSIADAMIAAPTILGIPSENSAQFVFTLIGLCTAHFAYGETLGPPLQVDPKTSEFLSARKAHIKTLVTAMVRSTP